MFIRGAKVVGRRAPRTAGLTGRLSRSGGETDEEHIAEADNGRDQDRRARKWTAWREALDRHTEELAGYECILARLDEPAADEWDFPRRLLKRRNPAVCGVLQVPLRGFEPRFPP